MDLTPPDVNKSRQSALSKEHNTKDLLDIQKETMDVESIEFGSDENWLYKPSNETVGNEQNLQKWLSEGVFKVNLQDDVSKHQKIDTRTFTRPKKKFSRPSLELYEQQMFNNNSDTTEMSSSTEGSSSGFATIGSEILPNKPLNFDLSQPTSSYYFDKVAAQNTAELDSFQNMSPPSLVNSLCSSTFANLMESSFIKNDPVLREIRDTDFTQSILLQDIEAPLFQSITESCSSINSDSPESFLKRVSLNGTFRRSFTKEPKTPDVGLNKEASNENIYSEEGTTEDLMNAKLSNSFGNLNGTYRRTPKLNGTFKKSDIRKAKLTRNATFELPNEEENNQNTVNGSQEKVLNSTQVLISADEKCDSMKRQNDSPKLDQNRLSYCIDDESIKLDSSYVEDHNEINRTVEIKRSSLGSADSLDRMSSLSGSSKGSNKMLNMADIDAIVEMQERSLNQVMSTPKPNTGAKKLWQNNFISPIVNTDSDVSSSDEYKSVKSEISSRVSVDTFSKKQKGYIRNNVIESKATKPQRNPVIKQKSLQTMPGTLRASYTTLKSDVISKELKTVSVSQTQFRTTHGQSNLKTMGPKLKGSYTSLRPMSANLPVAPPANPAMNSTVTVTKQTSLNGTRMMQEPSRVVHVQPMPREPIQTTQSSGDSTFVKPQIPRASALPRPTGIPRPSSRIPGPRSSNNRPVSSRTSNSNEFQH